ncbi:hypothetical protein [Kosakonia phage Kc166A]|uniref:Uncharacterized protein n=1 Tax=Kosakonia phage Kc166A TaxID=2801381 RepID=A0AAE7RFL7_9CAUD|nr:hypothetical protein [Kosakonia phage Kc166A]
MKTIMYGLCQHNLKSARELMLEANFSHDSMMAHLKSIYERRKAAHRWLVMSESYTNEAN